MTFPSPVRQRGSGAGRAGAFLRAKCLSIEGIMLWKEPFLRIWTEFGVKLSPSHDLLTLLLSTPT